MFREISLKSGKTQGKVRKLFLNFGGNPDKYVMLISWSIPLDCKPAVKCDDMLPNATNAVY